MGPFSDHCNFGAILGLLIVTGLPLQATTVTLQQGNLPTSGYAGSIDAFVTNGTTNNASPTRNYGAAGALAVAADSSVNSANTQGQFISYLQFDTSLAKSTFDSQFGAGDWTVTSVQLLLTAQQPNNAIFNGNGTLTNAAGSIDVRWLANNSWVEGTGTPALNSTTGLTYNNYTTYNGSSDEALGNFNFNGATSGLSTVSLNLTPNFTSDLLSGGLDSFELLPSASSQVSAVFFSRNYTGTGSPGDRPELSITAVAAPEPGHVTLLVLAIGAGMMGRRRMK